MELHEAIRRRAMVRSFSAEPLDRAVVDRILEAALRSPTAGNTGGTAWVVLEGPDQTAVYFDATTDEAWRAAHPDWSDGLRRAPVVLLAYASPEAYVARYAEPDKAAAGLGAGRRRPGRCPTGTATPPSASWPSSWPRSMPVSAPASSEPSGAKPRWPSRSASPTAGASSAPSLLGHPDGGDHRSALARPGAARRRTHRSRWGTAGGPVQPALGSPGAFDSTCSGPSCQRAMAHRRSESRLR